MGFTYFNIDYTGEIANFLADLSILQRESQFTGSGVINRNPSDAYLPQFATLKITANSLEAAGVPVFTISADMVDATDWNHDKMVDAVSDFLRERVGTGDD